MKHHRCCLQLLSAAACATWPPFSPTPVILSPVAAIRRMRMANMGRCLTPPYATTCRTPCAAPLPRYLPDITPCRFAAFHAQQPQLPYLSRPLTAIRRWCRWMPPPPLPTPLPPISHCTMPYLPFDAMPHILPYGHGNTVAAFMVVIPLHTTYQSCM